MFSLKHISKWQWVGIGACFVAVISYRLWVDSQLGLLVLNADHYYQRVFSFPLSKPNLFPNDPVFGNRAMAATAMAAYPIYLHLIDGSLRHFGFFEGFAAWQPVFALIYLLLTFYALYKLTGRPWLSTLIALISAKQTSIFPSEQWGVLSVGEVLPSTLFLLFAPLLFWLWYRTRQDTIQQRWFFLILGIFGTLHPLSWYTMTGGFLFAQLIEKKPTGSRLRQLLYCAGLSLFPLIPFLWGFFGGNHPSALPNTDTPLLIEGIEYAYPTIRPNLLLAWQPWLFTTFGWLLASLWAALGLYLHPCKGTSDATTHSRQFLKSLWLFGLGCLLIFIGGYGLNFWLIQQNHIPLMFDTQRALKFLMLPALFSVALWLARFHGSALCWRAGLIIFLTVILNGPMLGNDLFREPRWPWEMVQRQWELFQVSNQPAYFHDNQQSMAQLQETARWIQQNTPVDGTLIHVGEEQKRYSYVIRALGERSVTYGYFDGNLLYNHDKPKFLKWFRISKALSRLHQEQGFCSPTEVMVARHFQATHLLCPHQAVPLPHLHKVYENTLVTLYQL